MQEIQEKMFDAIINVQLGNDPFNINLYLNGLYAELTKYHDECRPDHVAVLGTSLNIGADDSLIRSRYKRILDLNLPEETGHSVDELMSFPTHELNMLFELVAEKAENKKEALDNIRKKLKDKKSNRVV